MLLGDDHAPVTPVKRCLAYLTSIARSANMIKGYATTQGLVRLARLDPIAVTIGPPPGPRVGAVRWRSFAVMAAIRSPCLAAVGRLRRSGALLAWQQDAWTHVLGCTPAATCWRMTR
jgi:hypothetical protein